jgi:hypothetical protein
MGRRARFLEVLTVALALGLPLRAETITSFANQVRADLSILSSEPMLTAWQKSRPGGKIESADYENREKLL